MNFRNITRILFLFIVSFAFVGALQGEEEDFLPGSGEIKEEDILERMQRELGEKPGPMKKTEKSENMTKVKKRPGRKRTFRIKATLQDAGEISGVTLLSQEFLILQNKEDSAIKVPIQFIRRINFSRWRLWQTRAFEGKNRAYYVPTHCKIVTRKNESLEGKCDIQDWMQVNLVAADSLRRLRSYYTQTRKSVTNEGPIQPGTLISISFLETKEALEESRTMNVDYYFRP